MDQEQDSVRILPEVVDMGPMIPLDQGLGLCVERCASTPGGVAISLAWDPETRYGFLGSLTPEKRERWMLQLVQNLNRMVAEELDSFELALPRRGPF